MTPSAAKKLDAILAQQEELLKQSVARCMAKVNAEPSSANLRDLRAAQKQLAELQRQEEAKNDGGKFTTVIEAARWIMAEGFLVKERSAHDHIKNNVPRQKDGTWLQKHVEEYALRTWQNLRRGQFEAGGTGGADHKEEIAKETARKLRMKNDEEAGLLIRREDVQQVWIQSAAFLKQDLSNFGPKHVDLTIERVIAYLRDNGIDVDGINLSSVSASLLDTYDTALAGWLDRYARHGEKYA
jgi:hypothetical protein